MKLFRSLTLLCLQSTADCFQYGYWSSNWHVSCHLENISWMMRLWSNIEDGNRKAKILHRNYRCASSQVKSALRLPLGTSSLCTARSTLVAALSRCYLWTYSLKFSFAVAAPSLLVAITIVPMLCFLDQLFLDRVSQFWLLQQFNLWRCHAGIRRRRFRYQLLVVVLLGGSSLLRQRVRDSPKFYASAQNRLITGYAPPSFLVLL